MLASQFQYLSKTLLYYRWAHGLSTTSLRFLRRKIIPNAWLSLFRSITMKGNAVKKHRGYKPSWRAAVWAIFTERIKKQFESRAVTCDKLCFPSFSKALALRDILLWVLLGGQLIRTRPTIYASYWCLGVNHTVWKSRAQMCSNTHNTYLLASNVQYQYVLANCAGMLKLTVFVWRE